MKRKVIFFASKQLFVTWFIHSCSLFLFFCIKDDAEKDLTNQGQAGEDEFFQINQCVSLRKNIFKTVVFLIFIF